MKSLAMAIPMALSLLGLFGPIAHAQPAATRVELVGPPTVAVGEEFEIEARLRTTEGVPIAGAVLELRQVGAVGERGIDEAATDAQGTAFLIHREYTVPVLTLRVVFRGTAAHAPSYADVSVDVTGIEVEPPVIMSHSPGPAVKTTLFLLLGSVWFTYVYAASRVVRVAREDRRIREGGRTR